MPQESNVLCCFSCKMFQTSLVKKAKKWQCKVCGEKQSIRQVYYQGSGKDCRSYVQMLNSRKQNEQQLESEVSENIDNAMENNFIDDINEDIPETVITGSKWAQYLNNVQHSEETECGERRRNDTEMENKLLVAVSTSRNKLLRPSSSSKYSPCTKSTQRVVKRNSTIDEYFSRKTVQGCDSMVDSKHKTNTPLVESSHKNFKRQHSNDYDTDYQIFKGSKMEDSMESAYSRNFEEESDTSCVQYKASLNTQNVKGDDLRGITAFSKSLKSFVANSPQDSKFTIVERNDSPKNEFSELKTKILPSNVHGDIENDVFVHDLDLSQTEEVQNASMVQSMKSGGEQILQSLQCKIDGNMHSNYRNIGPIVGDGSNLSFEKHKPELNSFCNSERNVKSIFENDDDLDDLLDFQC